jgi:hypothetical protein
MFRKNDKGVRADCRDQEPSGGKNLRLFDSEHGAAAVWADMFRGRSAIVEYAAFVYSLRVGGEKKYYTGRTHVGMGSHGRIRANVVIPFIYMYLFQSVIELIKRGARIEAFIHSHPQPGPGYTCRNHSPEDLLLLKLPGIKTVYVIPFENTEINAAARRSRAHVG